MSLSILIFSMHRANYLRECFGFFPDHLSLFEPKNSSTYSTHEQQHKETASHWYGTSSWGNFATQALRRGTRCYGITQFHETTWNIFNIVYNVKSNKQFLIFARTAWTRPTRPDPRVNPTIMQLWASPQLLPGVGRPSVEPIISRFTSHDADHYTTESFLFLHRPTVTHQAYYCFLGSILRRFCDFLNSA